MEFFRIVDVKVTEESIKELLSLENLDKMSELLFLLEQPVNNHAKIGGLWGEFTLSRNPIKGGLRFALDDCPNALAWTITTGFPPARESIVIHATINRERKPQEFLDEIDDFLIDQCTCIEKFLNKK